MNHFYQRQRFFACIITDDDWALLIWPGLLRAKSVNKGESQSVFFSAVAAA